MRIRTHMTTSVRTLMSYFVRTHTPNYKATYFNFYQNTDIRNRKRDRLYDQCCLGSGTLVPFLASTWTRTARVECARNEVTRVTYATAGRRPELTSKTLPVHVLRGLKIVATYCGGARKINLLRIAADDWRTHAHWRDHRTPPESSCVHGIRDLSQKLRCQWCMCRCNSIDYNGVVNVSAATWGSFHYRSYEFLNQILLLKSILIHNSDLPIYT